MQTYWETLDFYNFSGLVFSYFVITNVYGLTKITPHMTQFDLTKILFPSKATFFVAEVTLAGNNHSPVYYFLSFSMNSLEPVLLGP